MTNPSPQRMQEIQEIIESGVPVIKPIVNPEAAIIRNQAYAKAKLGEYPRTGCPHPLEAIEQYEDSDSSVNRHGRPVNLFQCSVCSSILWLVNPYGEAASDGR